MEGEKIRISITITPVHLRTIVSKIVPMCSFIFKFPPSFQSSCISLRSPFGNISIHICSSIIKGVVLRGCRDGLFAGVVTQSDGTFVLHGGGRGRTGLGGCTWTTRTPRGRGQRIREKADPMGGKGVDANVL